MAKMANKIPTYFAQRPMERVRYARPRVGIADVGAGLEAEAMGQFGKVLAGVSSDLLAKLEEQRTVSQFTEGKARWERAHNEFFISLAKDPDFENYEKKYTAFTKSLRRQILKKGLTRRAKQGLTNYITSQQPKMEKEAAISLMEKQRYQGRAVMLKAIDDFERSGNAPAALAAIQEAHESGFITAEEAERQRQSASTNIDWYKGLMLIDTDPQEFLDSLEGDTLPLKNLNPEQVLALKARAIRQQGALLAKGRELREEQINAEQGRLMNLARKNELTDDIIRTSALDEFGTGSKATFYSIIDARAKAAIADKDDPFLKSDPQVEARILSEIRDPDAKITEKDIADLVGKGLSVDDADRLIARLDVFSGFWFKRADLYLKQNLGWSETYVKFLHPEGALSYSVAMEELFTVIEEEGLKDDKELYDRARAIATPHLIDYWEKALFFGVDKIARLKRMLEIKPPTAKPPKPEPLEGKPEKPAPEARPPIVREPTPRQKAARKARIRSWVVPFNLKHKTRLQPSVLDAMSDEFINWLASLSSVEREEVLRKIEAGETVEPEPIKKRKIKKGTDLDPEGIFQ